MISGFWHLFKADPQRRQQWDRIEDLLAIFNKRFKQIEDLLAFSNERLKFMALDFSEVRSVLDMLKADVARIAGHLEANAADQEAVNSLAKELRGVVATIDTADPAIDTPTPRRSPRPRPRPIRRPPISSPPPEPMAVIELAPDALMGDRVAELASGWLGTPYHHQASAKGVGCDCLGLVRGVYAELYGRPAAAPPPYSRDLAEASRRETLLEAAREHLAEVWFKDAARPGDVVVFRLRAGAVAKHCAIISGASRMIHAFESGPVCEVHFTLWWQRRVAALFRFPSEPRI